MKKFFILGIIVAATYFWAVERGLVPATQEISYSANSSDQVLATAFEKRSNQLEVQGEGRVIRTLSDDNDGSNHQRFIIRLASGQTLLIAHNIDLAARINSLKVDDYVEFKGDYEWNREGGVIHWTHRDPHGRHVAGWLKHKGRTYQ